MFDAHVTAPHHRKHRVHILVSMVVASVLAFALPGVAVASTTPPPAPADTTVSWGVRPANSAQGSGRPNFNYEMGVGETLADALIVTNHGDEVLELDVYAADGFLTPDGSLDILPSGEESTELGSWIDLGAEQVTLAGGESIEVPFDLVVPAGIQPGDYAAGIVAAMRVESATGVVTERRLGSRVLLRVAGDLTPAIAVSNVSIVYDGTLNPVEAGTSSVAFTLQNTGNTRIASDALITVSGPFGIAALKVNARDIPELLPGTSIDHVVKVDGVFPLVILTADVATSATVVERPGDEATQLPSVAAASGTSTAMAIPWVALGILLVVIAFIVWWQIARRRAKKAHQQQIDAAVAAALGAREAAAEGGAGDAAAADAVNADATAIDAADPTDDVTNESAVDEVEARH